MAALSVTIVCVSFRSAQLVIDCLSSVAPERHRSELRISAIVVDNASGDYPALSKAVEDNGWSSWVTVLLAPRNGGFAYGNNIGIRLALEREPSGYLLLLNPDTQVRPGAIAKLANFLESHTQIGIAGGSFEDGHGADWPIAFRFPTLVSEFCSALEVGFITRLFRRWTVAVEMQPVVQRTDWICGACMMIRPEVFRAIGGLDENYFLYFEETDFCLRAKRAGFATWYFPESRVMHIMGQSTKVTEPRKEPKRLPDYWFESRRRYFAVNCGPGHAALIDLVVLLTYPIGLLKRTLVGSRHLAVPRYLRDFWRHSILRAQNRQLSPIRAQVSQDAPPREPADSQSEGSSTPPTRNEKAAREQRQCPGRH